MSKSVYKKIRLPKTFAQCFMCYIIKVCITMEKVKITREKKNMKMSLFLLCYVMCLFIRFIYLWPEQYSVVSYFYSFTLILFALILFLYQGQ